MNNSNLFVPCVFNLYIKMHILLETINSSNNHTNGRLSINCDFQCYTLEDEYRKNKVFSETRIPVGTYVIKFRKKGGHHNRYLKRYGKDWHFGMLELQDVPNFKYILIHCGNTDKDTAGCILVGLESDEKSNFIGDSRGAYKKIYPLIRNALLKGEEVKIEIC